MMKKTSQKCIALASLLMTSFSPQSLAHVRWFAESQGKFSNVEFRIDTITLLITQGALLFCWFCWRLQVAAKENKALAAPLQKSLSPNGKEWFLLGPLVAICLLANHLSSIFVAPNIILNDCCHDTALLFQLALVLPALISPLTAGVAILLGLAYLPAFTPPNLVIDYLFAFSGIALAMIFIAPSVSILDKRILQNLNIHWSHGKAKAASCLRIGLGLQLLTLALHNKLLDPGLGLMFLADNPQFNFMSLIGIESFKDIHFVFAGGVAEACFGLMLLVKFSTRLVVAIVCFFFFSSSLVLGPHELVGHLPIMGAALLIFLQSHKQGIQKAVIEPQSSPIKQPLMALYGGQLREAQNR